jgi:hypothetical protein
MEVVLALLEEAEPRHSTEENAYPVADVEPAAEPAEPMLDEMRS